MPVSHYYVTPDDGVTRLHVCCVRPEGMEAPRFVLQIVHGFAERTGRYLPLLSMIASCGGIALIHDLRGHGHSVPNARLLGHCGELYGTYRADLDLVYASVYEYPAEGAVISPRLPESYEIPALPRYLFGFGMGAAIAGLYAAESSADLAGLILSGLPRRQPFVSGGIFGLELLSLFVGERRKPQWLNNAAFRKYDRKFPCEPESDENLLWFAAGPEVREAFRNDPLCSRPSSVGTYAAAGKLVRDLYRPASWNMDRRDLPILLTAGEDDPVTGGAKGRKDSAKFLADMGYTDIRTKAYPGFRHALYHDAGWEAPFADVIGFVEDTLAAENARRQRKMDEYQSMFT